MQLPKVCVFSGSTDNLNTKVTVKLSDGRMVEAFVSDAYADSSIKSISDAVEKMLVKIDTKERERSELIKRAAELGLSLVDDSVKQMQPKQDQPRQIQPKQTPAQIESSSNMLPASAVDNKTLNVKVNGNVSGVSGPSSEYEIKSVDKPSVDIKADEKVELGQFPGRGGVPIRIPSRRVSSIGETRVKIIDTGGDAALQKNFKNFAKDTVNNMSNVDFRKGYSITTITCGVCRGTGRTMNKICPKCSGDGIIETNELQ